MPNLTIASWPSAWKRASTIISRCWSGQSNQNSCIPGESRECEFWLRHLAQRQALPDFGEGGDQRLDIGVAVQWRRGQAQAFGAARPGRVVDRLHADPVPRQQRI